jgi:uncharacterized membrane protein YphA (DoxX/SURF4 family)
MLLVLVGLPAQLLLGVFFTPEGVIKWTHIGPSTARFQHFRYPMWFRYLTGVVEVLIGLSLLVGLWIGWLAALAALLLVVEMLVAIASHLLRGHDPFVPDAVPAVAMLLLTLPVLALHWGNLLALVR